MVVEPWNTTIKLGGSNLLENIHIEAYGGPYVGRMLYGSLIYEFNHVKDEDERRRNRIQDLTPVAMIQSLKRAGRGIR